MGLLPISARRHKTLAKPFIGLWGDGLLCCLGALAMITSQTEPGEVQSAIEDVLRDFFGGKELRRLRGNFLCKTMHGSRFIEIACKNGGGDVAPAMEAFSIAGDMRLWIIAKGEVSKQKFFRMNSGDSVKRSVPEFNGDIRRRRGRENEGMAIDGDPRGIANESNSLRDIEISDVVRSVAGRIKNLELARA